MLSRRTLLITGGASILVLGGGYAGLSAMSNIAPAREPWRQATEGFWRCPSQRRGLCHPCAQPAQSAAMDDPAGRRRQPHPVLRPGAPPARNRPRQTARRRSASALSSNCCVRPRPNRVTGWRSPGSRKAEPGDRLDERPVAHVRFVQDPDVERDPLFGLRAAARTARAKFDPGRPVPSDKLAALMEISNALPSPWRDRRGGQQQARKPSAG